MHFLSNFYPILIFTLYCFILFQRIIFVNAIGPLTALGGASGVVFVSSTAYCWLYECCDNIQTWYSRRWIHSSIEDLNELEKDLYRRVYGQPLATEIIVTALKQHFNNPHPKKPLVISFHGWTGIGKTFVSEIIGEHIFYKGVNSEFYDKISLTEYFPNPNDSYRKHELITFIRNKIAQCPKRLFVIDEIDKMPSSFMDLFKTLIDYSSYKENNAIFILLSNTGGRDINNLTHQNFLNGKKRSELDISQVDAIVKFGSFNEDGGLQKSDLIHKSLIDYVVPFLPLERSHAKLCLNDLLKNYNAQMKTQPNNLNEFFDQILDALPFFPEDMPTYLVNGCKNLDSKLYLKLSREKFPMYTIPPLTYSLINLICIFMLLIKKNITQALIKKTLTCFGTDVLFNKKII